MRRAKADTIVMQANRADMADADTPAQAIVYFDGAWPLCTAEIKHYNVQNPVQGSAQLFDSDHSGANWRCCPRARQARWLLVRGIFYTGFCAPAKNIKPPSAS